MNICICLCMYIYIHIYIKYIYSVYIYILFKLFLSILNHFRLLTFSAIKVILTNIM